jgi:hypothetical protein
MKCPKCGSVKIQGQMVVHGVAWVDMDTLDVSEVVCLEADANDLEMIDQFICAVCDHYWCEEDRK